MRVRISWDVLLSVVTGLVLVAASLAAVADEVDVDRVEAANEVWLNGEQPELTHSNTLLDTLIQARRHDAEYAAAQAALMAGREAWPQARAAVLPSLRGEVNITETERDVEATPFANTPGGGGGGAGGPPSAPFTDDFTSEQYRIELRQPLFNFSIPALLKQGRLQVSKAELDFAISRKLLISRVAGAYLDFLAAAEQVNLTHSEKKALAEDLELAKARYEVGETGVTGLREAQAAYDLVMANLVDTRTALDNARDVLYEFTQVSYPQLASARKNFTLEMPAPSSVDEWIKIALTYNGEYLKSRQDVVIARNEINGRRGDQLPKLDLVASYSELDDTEFVFGNASTDKSIGLQASWDLFSGGRTFSRVREARALHTQSQARLTATGRQIATAIRSNYRAVAQAIKRAQAQEQVIASARAALDSTAAGFEVGERTQADVLNARRTLFQAKVEKSNVRYRYLRSLLQLKLVAGVISTNDLKEVGAILSGPLVPSRKYLTTQE